MPLRKYTAPPSESAGWGPWPGRKIKAPLYNLTRCRSKLVALTRWSNRQASKLTSACLLHAFLVCTHDLPQQACLPLQDTESQQEPGTDGGLHGEGHTGGSHQGRLSPLVQEGTAATGSDCNRYGSLHWSTPVRIPFQDRYKSIQQSAFASLK